MPDQVFGLTRGAAKLLGQIADKHRQRLPDVGRRTRRVGRSGGGATRVVRIQCEIDSWNASALHGPGAVCIVKFQVGPGDIFDSDYSDPDLFVTVYDATPSSSVFGDGSGLTGKWVWADLMMPVGQTNECPEETGTVSPTSTCRWVASGVTCE